MTYAVVRTPGQLLNTKTRGAMNAALLNVGNFISRRCCTFRIVSSSPRSSFSCCPWILKRSMATASSNRESPITLHKCDKCSYIASSFMELLHHRETHRRPLMCTHPGCFFTARSPEQLLVHGGKHSGIKVLPYKCNVGQCTFAAKTTFNLRRHVESLHAEGRVWLKCTSTGCHYSTKNADSFKIHSSIPHHMQGERYICDIPGCRFTSSKVWNFLSHQRVHVDDKQYRCDVEGCYAEFTRRSSLQRHYESHHRLEWKRVRQARTTRATTAWPKSSEQRYHSSEDERHADVVEVESSIRYHALFKPHLIERCGTSRRLRVKEDETEPYDSGDTAQHNQ